MNPLNLYINTMQKQYFIYDWWLKVIYNEYETVIIDFENECRENNIPEKLIAILRGERLRSIGKREPEHVK